VDGCLAIAWWPGRAVGTDGHFHAFWTDSNNQQSVVWFHGAEFVPTPINREDVVTVSGGF
jgi:hypothetical protein